MLVSELSGVLLDYWVARADQADLGPDWNQGEYVILGGHSGRPQIEYSPSTDWAQGGPIIERDQIFLTPPGDIHYSGGPNHGWRRYDHWRATVSARTRTLPPKNDIQEALDVRGVGRGAGETALIAAMRAKVASHYGDEVPDAV